MTDPETDDSAAVGQARRGTRRDVLAGGLALAAAPALAHAASFDQTPLKDIAARSGRRFGSTVGKDALSDPGYASLLTRECGLLVSEDFMTWGQLNPAPGKFDFTRADTLLKFSQQHGLPMRGHALVFDKWLPKDLASWSGGSPTDFMIKYVDTVVRHYGDRIQSWDVVNEAVTPPQGRPDGLRNNPFLQQAGPEYLVMAFQAAHAAAPHADLVYNDWVDGYDNRFWEARRTGILKLLEFLKSKGAPITAVGLESHLSAGFPGFSTQIWGQFCSEIRNLGLTVHLTELSVADNLLPADVATRDAQVAFTAQRYLNTTFEHAHVGDIIAWDLSDKYSSLPRYSPRKDGVAPRGAPYDAQYRPKLLRQIIAQTLTQAPKL